MAVFEGTFISSWLYLISFLVLAYGFAGSVIARVHWIRFKAQGLHAKYPKWLRAEATMNTVYLVLPAYLTTSLHEYEGFTVNHIVILAGAAITTVNWLRGYRDAVDPSNGETKSALDVSRLKG